MKHKIEGFAVGESTIEELWQDINKYSEPVKKLIWDELCLRFDHIDSELMDMKSPIEQALYMAWENSGLRYPLERMTIRRALCESVVFIPQYEVKIGPKTYYLDFLLGIWLPNDKSINIAIECDGHDFHEKTKEQARRDKQRERALMKAGYTVIRFTGSEIHADPYKCADEIYEVAKQLIQQHK